jgi:two-component system alkaline phosphatase synthesis response regulator PhoP
MLGKWGSKAGDSTRIDKRLRHSPSFNNASLEELSAMKHILIVEDEQHLAVGIKYNLEAEGYQVTTVSDGPKALDLLEQDTGIVDLIVLDIMLPGMSGYTVCEILRKRGVDIPILILSARTLTEDRTRGFEMGADQYLSKPFELDELLSRVKNMIALYERRSTGKGSTGSSDAVRPTLYEFGNNKVNFETYEVTVSGKPKKLTELEMKLLTYFVENEGRVIRRDELLENVWDMPSSISTRAVDQFIRRLRKIFEPDPSRPRYFLTLRDAGYRFVAKER